MLLPFRIYLFVGHVFVRAFLFLRSFTDNFIVSFSAACEKVTARLDIRKFHTRKP